MGSSLTLEKDEWSSEKAGKDQCPELFVLHFLLCTELQVCLASCIPANNSLHSKLNEVWNSGTLEGEEKEKYVLCNAWLWVCAD